MFVDYRSPRERAGQFQPKTRKMSGRTILEGLGMVAGIAAILLWSTLEVASEVSGSSSIQVKGDVRSLDASASGSSKFEVEGDPEKADVELSGASKGRLTVTQQLKYELSGVSTLKVKDKGIATKHGQASRSAKVEFVR